MTLANVTAKRSVRIVCGVILALYYSLSLAATAGHAGVRDGDRDGMPTRWEVNHGLNPRIANAGGNPDHDGLKNIGEYHNDAEPKDEDTDNDGIDDGDEVKLFETDVDDADTNNNGVEDGDQDADHDGVDNEDEDDLVESCLADDDDRDDDGVDNEDENDFGSKEGDSDSDDDGIEDGNEDSDDDGIDNEDSEDDEDDACEDDAEDEDDLFASIVSYDAATGVLTLQTVAGLEITGTVTELTEVEFGCDPATIVDLVPGAGISDLEFDDETGALEEVELLSAEA